MINSTRQDLRPSRPINYRPDPRVCAHGLTLTGLRLVTTPRPHDGASRVAAVFPLVGMLSPIPRRNPRVHSSLASPAVAAFPEFTVGSASASPFSRLAQRSLTLRPAYSPSHLKRPSTPEASAASLPPRLLRLLPAGAKVAGWDSHPLKDRAFARRTRKSG